MAGKLIVRCRVKFTPKSSAIQVLIDGEAVGVVSELQEFTMPIVMDCEVSVKGFVSNPFVNIKNNTETIVQAEYNAMTGKTNLWIVSENPIIQELDDSGECEVEEPVYKIRGVRGRRISVYEDRCVITTTAGVGSFITGNLTDGEKTIYYTDCIGVQFRKAGVLIGYLQLETASATMNNKGDNFFNENTFTFDGSTISNEEMEEVSNYVKKKVQESKTARNAPVVVASATSAADEIKKFKELLDMGIITQEEFDAKKKQLLGL